MLTITANPISPTAINVTINLGGNVSEQIKMYRDGSPIATLAAGTTIYHDTGLSANTLYVYEAFFLHVVVSEVDSGGPGSATTPAVPPPPPPPPPPVNPPVFSLAARDVGMDSQLVAWGALTPSPWLWQAAPCDFLGTGYPSIVVGDHNGSAAGCKIFDCNIPNNGQWTYTDTTASQYNIDGKTLGSAGGTLLFLDINNDGYPDFITTSGSTTSQPGSYLINGQLVKQGAAVDLSGGYGNYYNYFGDLDGDGDVDAYSHPSLFPNEITSLESFKRVKQIWNGSGYTEVMEPRPIPAGIPEAVKTAVVANLKSPTFEKGHPRFYTMDLDNDGLDDLVVATYFAYNSQLNSCWFLKNNGDGTYTDNGAAWGLPNVGNFMPLMPAHLNIPRLEFCDQDLHKMIDGQGSMHLFISRGTAPGIYKWTGTTYTKQIVTVFTAAGNDDYMQQCLAVDFTNTGVLDIVFDSPRNTGCWVLKNNGSGVFTQYNGPTYPNNRFVHWSPQGLSIFDWKNNGRMAMLLGGSNGTGSGGGGTGAAARCLRIYENTTTDIGNYLKVKLLRASGNNRVGLGSTIEIFEAGTTTRIGKWPANYFGMATHFGVGNRSTVDVKVTWPDGTITNQYNVSVNQTITVSV